MRRSCTSTTAAAIAPARCWSSCTREDSRVCVVEFARNFGHQMAVTAGIEQAGGDAVVVIDADLQDPPHAIPQMVQLWKEGYQVVYGQRIERPGEPRLRLAAIRLFYRFLRWCSDTPMPMDSGDFRLLDRQVVDALRKMPEHDRYLRGMISWAGFRQMPLPYRRSERFAGVSKYPLRKLVRLAADAILSFSMAPLRLATCSGIGHVAADAHWRAVGMLGRAVVRRIGALGNGLAGGGDLPVRRRAIDLPGHRRRIRGANLSRDQSSGRCTSSAKPCRARTAGQLKIARAA